MLMPATLPAKLRQYAQVETERDLIETLSKRPGEFISFFEAAAEDETWCEKNSAFTKATMEWMSSQALNERLSRESIEKIAEIIHTHYPVLHSFIPNDLTVYVNGTDFPMNALLLMAESEFFQDLIHIKCHLQGKSELELHDLSSEHFRIMKEYLYTHSATGLWKFEKHELFTLINEADAYKLPGLRYFCEDQMKKYIDQNNVVEMLIEAHNASWNHLRELCFEFINSRFSVKLTTVEEENEILGHAEMRSLSFEFFDFSQSALMLFSHLKNLVTQIVCKGVLTLDPSFSQVVKSCTHLIGIDINGSLNFSERLFDIPSEIEKLDLSSCQWLTDDAFKRIITITPHLKKLGLESNLELTYVGFSSLQKLRGLRSLDISRNPHLRDDDFSLIVKGSPGLIELKVSGCSGLSNKAFFLVGKNLPQLQRLDVSNTAITDGMLLEIISRCEGLQELNISHCRELSEKGIVHAVELGHALTMLTAKHCHLSHAAVQEITTTRPRLLFES